MVNDFEVYATIQQTAILLKRSLNSWGLFPHSVNSRLFKLT